MENAWLEVLHQPTDETGRQVSGLGREVIANHVQVGSVAQPSLDPLAIEPSSSSPSVGLKGSKRAGGLPAQSSPMGLKLKGVVVDEVGPTAGSLLSKAKWWVADVESPSPVGLTGLEGVSPGPSQIQSFDRSLLVKACLDTSNESNTEVEFFKLWEKEVMRKQQMEVHQSATDRAVVEEASRYGSILNT